MTNPHITVEQLLQHQDWLFRFVRGMVRDDFSADDMVQATMAEALESPNAGKVDLKSWLAGTARNLVRNQWRSNARRRMREEKVSLPVEAIRNRSTEIAEFMAETNLAIGQLPERERVAILLRYLQELKPKQIAVELELPVGEVYRLLESSRSKLRGRMEQRFGKDWQTLGVGLMAVPTLQAGKTGTSASAATKTQSPLLFAAGIAVLAVGATGYWIFGNGNSHGQDAPEVLTAATTTASQGNTLLGEDPTRSSAVLGLQSGPTVHARAVLPDGTPLEHAQMELRFEGIGNDPLLAITDEDGHVVFMPPQDATGFELRGRAEGLWCTSLALPQPFGTTHELPFQAGQFSMDYAVLEGTPGVTLEVTGDAYAPITQRWFGSVTTDSHGKASLPVPAHGEYFVKPIGSLAGWTSATFQVAPGPQPAPVVVSFVSPGPLEVEVLLEGTSTVLDSARYFHSETSGRIAGIELQTYQEIPSSAGRFSHPEPPDAWRYGMVVRAPGFRDACLVGNGNRNGPLQVHLDPVGYVEAQLTSPSEGVQWTGLQMVEKVPQFAFGSWGRGWESTMNGTSTRTLEVSPDGTFRLPRVLHGKDGYFHLFAMDSLGRRHAALDLHPESRAQSAPEFPMTLAGNGALRFSTPNAWPISTSDRILGGWMEAWDHPNRKLEMDPQGFFTLPGTRGSLAWVRYKTRDLHYNQVQRIPVEESESPLALIDYPRDGQLSGTLVQSDGSPLPAEAVIRARFRGHLEAHDLPGGDQAEFTLLLRPDGIMLQSVPCPKGLYDLGLRLGQHYIEFEGVSTDGEFNLRLPDLQLLIAQARDRNTALPLGADLYRVPEGAGEKEQVIGTDRSTGHVAAPYRPGSDLSRWALATWEYEPFVLDQAIPGMMFTADLIPGRALRLDPSPMDIQPIEGNRWICSTWGNQDDPRQAFISVFQNRINHLHAPATEFEMLEVDPDGTYTGRSFLVHEDGSLTDTSS